jgi:hypothetical protein
MLFSCRLRAFLLFAFLNAFRSFLNWALAFCADHWDFLWILSRPQGRCADCGATVDLKP